MRKYAKIVNEETKLCEVGLGTNNNFYASIGMEEMEVEQDYAGNWYLAGYAPVKPEPTIEEQNEAIRATREQLYIQTSDKLKADYDEAVARGAENAEELKTAWLESKDKIREENPYIVESVEDKVAEIKENNPYPVVEESEEVIEDGLQRKEKEIEEPVVELYSMEI